MKRMKRITLIMVCFFVIILGTNAYAGLNLVVYNGGGPESAITTAIWDLGLTIDSVTVRDDSVGNGVKLADLATADALIVGWNYQGNMSGLDETILATGIKGNILITGHDADWHVVNGKGITGSPGDAVDDDATKFLKQAILFATEQTGTGLVALADFTEGFDYLPDSWGITAIAGLAGDEEVKITGAGDASGVYDGLTNDDMSPWVYSYHNVFDEFDPRFVVFENHHSVIEPITIGYVVPVPAALLLGLLGLSVAGVKLRKFA